MVRLENSDETLQEFRQSRASANAEQLGQTFSLIMWLHL